ncbi:hypothetical protein B0A48_00141 [Cryoendolithus antarcticus]|uniref:Defective in cullin neddylation protein n=1 Tax=Cryoendolithus antarcticus TaxID=1507870 RepID=A0A1V8TTV0_9PEZI|nr:hypothetical protein B0A48_00141 [Cryoendolithus antarcticus]
MPKRKSDQAELNGVGHITETTTLRKPKKMKRSEVSAMPTPSTSQQKAAIAEFTSVTNANTSAATKLLKQHNWNSSNAINAFFNNPSNAAANPARKSLDRIFDSYRTSPRDSPDELDLEGTGNLLQALSIDLEDIGSLVFFEVVQSPQIGVITRQGFADAFSDVNADSLPKIRNVILGKRAEMTRDRALFKRVYNHTFQLLLEDRKKAMDFDQAAAFWRVLFSDAGLKWETRNSPWLEWWLEYLESEWKKAVNKDLWRQTLTFAEETLKDEDLGFWNEESSWPSVIDEFVEWVKSKKRSGGEAMEVE